MSSKRKRVVLTVEKKLEIIKRRDQGESVKSLADEFGIGEQTARDVIKNQASIEEFVSRCETFAGPSQRKSLKGARNEQLEREMIKWFLQQRSEGNAVTGPMVLNKARYFYHKLEIPGTFKFSAGWLKRFKDRHGIWDFGTNNAEFKELDEGNISEWLNVEDGGRGCEQVTGGGLVRGRDPEAHPIVVSSEEEDDEESTGPYPTIQIGKVTSKEALIAAKTLLHFMENQDDVDWEDISLIRGCIGKIENIRTKNKQ